MRKLLSLTGYLLLVSSCNVTFAQSWDRVGDALRTSVSSYVSLALDGTGTPYVAFADWGYAGKVSVAKFENNNWAIVGDPGFSEWSAYHTSLAIDTRGKLYLAYTDEYVPVRANVMSLTGHKWVSVGGKLSEKACCTSLVLGNDTPYLAYKHGEKLDTVTVLKYNGSSWVPVGSEGVSASGGISLAIDGYGTPYVAYKDSRLGGKGTVRKYDGGSWVPVGSDDVSGHLAIDGNGTPYVAYADNAIGGRATVKKYDGSNWVPVGNAGFSADIAETISLAIDRNGTPYMVYTNHSYSLKATVMKYRGGSWVVVGTPSVSEHNVSSPCLAVDHCGTPYVACSNWEYLSNDHSVTLQKPTLEVLASVYPNPTTNGTFEVSVPDAGTMTVYTMEGRDVMTSDLKAGTTELTLPSSTATGVYICRFNSKTGAHISLRQTLLR